MTISVSDTIVPRPWRGYDDPGLPVGMYFAQNAVTGDMTGGDMIVFFLFKAEAEPVSGRFFNIEQINVFHSDTATKSAHVSANNWESVSPAGLVNRQWKLQLITNANDVAAMGHQLYFPLPLFLGQAAPVRDLECQVEVGVDNVTVSSLVVSIQGYIWEPRGMLAPGGLRRPVDSLYGKG